MRPILDRTLRLAQLVLRGLQLLSALIIIALTGYALADSSDDTSYADARHYSVVGIAVVAFLYAAVNIVLLAKTTVHMWSSFILILFDLAFVGTSIFIAVVHGDGARNCESGGLPKGETATGCRLQKAVMATAIASVLLFVLSVPTQVGITRHQVRENRLSADFKTEANLASDPTTGLGTTYSNTYGNPFSSIDTEKKASGGFFSNMFRSKSIFRRNTVKSENRLPVHTQPYQLHRPATNSTAINNGNNSPYGYGRPSYATDNTYVNAPSTASSTDLGTAYPDNDHIYDAPPQQQQQQPDSPLSYNKYYGGGNSGYQYLHPNRQTPQTGDQFLR